MAGGLPPGSMPDDLLCGYRSYTHVRPFVARGGRPTFIEPRQLLD